MKKVFYFGLFLTVICAATSCKTASKLSPIEQARANQGKVVLDNLKKEGWEMNDISRSLELAVLEHQEKRNDPANQGLVATIQCKIMSNCVLTARTEAARHYAQQARSMLRERITGDNNLGQGNPDTEFAKLYAGYESLVQKEIQGEIVQSFDVVRNVNGVKEYKAFFIVNEDKASAARLRALDRALKETQAAQKSANEISQFVQEGFKVSEE